MEQDIKELEKLVLTDKQTCIPNFREEPWCNAVLVTPRNSVRAAWNRAALRRHCARTGNHLYVVRSEDTTGNPGKSCNMSQKLTISKLKTDKTARLAHRVELAVRMQVMVTLNVATEADLANGSRGIIESIVLDGPQGATIIDQRQ